MALLINNSLGMLSISSMAAAAFFYQKSEKTERIVFSQKNKIEALLDKNSVLQGELNTLKMQTIAENLKLSVVGIKKSLHAAPEVINQNSNLIIALLPYIAGTIALALICYFGPSFIVKTSKAASSAVSEISNATAGAAKSAVAAALKSQTEASMVDSAGNIAEVIITGGKEFQVFVTLVDKPGLKLLHPIIDAHKLMFSLKPSIGITPEIAQAVADKLFS
jgi:hypothetical protein